MNRPCLFDSDSVGNPSHRKGFPYSAVLTLDDGALKNLGPFSRAFDNFRVDANRVADFKRRRFFLELLGLDLPDNLVRQRFLPPDKRS
jgi:hypothetical protein